MIGRFLLTDSTTFLVHEDDPILCPLTCILALAFADNAFPAQIIKSLNDFYRLRVRRSANSLTIKWKKTILKSPLLRQATRRGPLITSQKPLRYPIFNHDIARLGESAGFEDTLGGCCRRCVTGNAVDGESLRIQFAHYGRSC